MTCILVVAKCFHRSLLRRPNLPDICTNSVQGKSLRINSRPIAHHHPQTRKVKRDGFLKYSRDLIWYIFAEEICLLLAMSSYVYCLYGLLIKDERLLRTRQKNHGKLPQPNAAEMATV